MSNLKLCEREKIEFLLRCKQGIREIGRLMRRDHGVISREIKRNGGNSGYDANRARAMADKRLAHNTIRKLDKDPKLKQYVVEQLKKDWSPKAIAGRLKEYPPAEMLGKQISHESIYQYIYTGEGRYENLYPYLVRGKPRRQKRHTRKSRKTLIPERKSIHLRPEEINNRSVYGHWESDSMIFKKQREIISVQYERKTKLVRIHKLRNKTAEETKNALINTIESMQSGAVKSITFDNGGEGALHAHIRNDWQVDTYFCDPYCSWQKGGVENENGIIRRYLPANADLSKLTARDIHDIQEHINDIPRESLNFKTPNEFALELKWTSGALIT